MIRGLDLVKGKIGGLRRLPLVCNEGRVDVEGFFKRHKWAAPPLVIGRHGVCSFDPNKKSPLKIKDGVDIKEDLVDNISRNNAPLFQGLLKVVQILEILDVLALGINQLLEDMIPVAHLGGCGLIHGVLVRIRLRLEEQSTLLGDIEHIIDDLRDLITMLERRAHHSNRVGASLRGCANSLPGKKNYFRNGREK